MTGNETTDTARARRQSPGPCKGCVSSYLHPARGNWRSDSSGAASPQGPAQLRSAATRKLPPGLEPAVSPSSTGQATCTSLRRATPGSPWGSGWDSPGAGLPGELGAVGLPAEPWHRPEGAGQRKERCQGQKHPPTGQPLPLRARASCAGVRGRPRLFRQRECSEQRHHHVTGSVSTQSPWPALVEGLNPPAGHQPPHGAARSHRGHGKSQPVTGTKISPPRTDLPGETILLGETQRWATLPGEGNLSPGHPTGGDREWRETHP